MKFSLNVKKKSTNWNSSWHKSTSQPTKLKLWYLAVIWQKKIYLRIPCVQFTIYNFPFRKQISKKKNKMPVARRSDGKGEKVRKCKIKNHCLYASAKKRVHNFTNKILNKIWCHYVRREKYRDKCAGAQCTVKHRRFEATISEDIGYIVLTV